MISQEVEYRPILPLVASKEKQESGMIYEPDEITILDAAVPEYVAGVLVSAVRESFASEVAARRCAMDSAGKNAQGMIDELQLQYNRARQGAITQEITEIVAGSGAERS
jgi:F-type H+-transporting ATPase subunit gamma